VVNRAATAQSVRIKFSGASSVASSGRVITISGSGPDDTNSITEPRKVVPVISEISGLSADFSHSFAPYSVNVLELKTTSSK
jgi:alpha-L-arabinofuranosidase